MSYTNKFLTLLMLLATFASAEVVINEVCYSNSKVADETGDASSDWIELYNRGPAAVNLYNYGLGDANPYVESKGVRLPNYTLYPGDYLVVFASSDLDDDYTAWVAAPDQEVVPLNTVWRYHSSSSAPAGSWQSEGYNHNDWSVGMAPLGYNDASANLDCATVLGYGGNSSNRYPAAYFRRQFNVVNPLVVTGMVVRVRCNDGMVLYLNNSEINRYNMPAGAVTHSTLASSVKQPTNWHEVTLPKTGLVQGSNTLAVELHQAALNSGDLIFDLSLTLLIDEQRPVVHGKFGLSKEGENVHLFDSTLKRIQKFEPPATEPGKNNSYGCVVDGVITGDDPFRVFTRTTPGGSNAFAVGEYEEILENQPLFSVPPGFYQSSQSVTLSMPGSGVKIYYTTDGSDPKMSSTYLSSGQTISIGAVPAITSGRAWIRTNPVEIELSGNMPAAAWLAPVGSVDKAVVLRAVAVDASGRYCSAESCGTYFIGSSFSGRTMPVVAITTNDDDLFGYKEGLFVPGKSYGDSPVGYGSNRWGKPYANYHETSDEVSAEKPIYLELFEPGSVTAAVGQMLGLQMHGGGSRAIPQKSLYLLARNSEYGNMFFNGVVFPEQPELQHKRFLLRNSGNDWYGPDTSIPTMLKDAILHELVSDMDIAIMDYRPALVYINGEYWGIHNIRDSYDKHYPATRYGIDPENVDLLSHVEDPDDSDKIRIKRISGDKNADEDYEEMVDWIKQRSLSVESNYEQVTQWVDVTNHIDYIIAETFMANTDWPHNNCDFWRANTNQVESCGRYGDTRWRWMLYDLDVAGADGVNKNMFVYLSSNKMTGASEPGFLINKLWENPGFRVAFIDRYEMWLNTSLRPEYTAVRIAAAAQEIEDEIERHFRRWGRNFTKSEWQNSVSEALVEFVATRHEVSWSHLSGKFNLGGAWELTVRNRNAQGQGGYFIVNGIEIKPGTPGVVSRTSWSGTFFRNKSVVVEAVPDEGYVFSGWSRDLRAGRIVEITPGDDPQEWVGHFEAADTPMGTRVYILNQ